MTLSRLRRVIGPVLLGASVVMMATAWLAGWRVNVIESESMAPVLHRNSVALVAPVHAASIEPGDVIEFSDSSRGGRRVLHRVSQVIDHGQGRFFQTKGDANDRADSWLVPATAVEGRMSWHLAHLGAVTRVLAPPRGLVVLVGLPLLLGLVTEIRRMRSAHEGCPTCGVSHAGLERRDDLVESWTQEDEELFVRLYGSGLYDGLPLVLGD